LSQSLTNKSIIGNLVSLLIRHHRFDVLIRLSQHEPLREPFEKSIHDCKRGELFPEVIKYNLIPVDRINFNSALFNSYLTSLIPEIPNETPVKSNNFFSSGEKAVRQNKQEELNGKIEQLKILFANREEELLEHLERFFLKSSKNMRALMYSQSDLLKNINFAHAPLADMKGTRLEDITTLKLIEDFPIVETYFRERHDELGEWLLNNMLISKNGTKSVSFRYKFSDKQGPLSEDQEFIRLACGRLGFNTSDQSTTPIGLREQSPLEYKRQLMNYYSKPEHEVISFLEHCCLRDSNVALNWLKGELGEDLFQNIDFNNKEFCKMISWGSRPPEFFNLLEARFSNRFDELKSFISTLFNSTESLPFALKHDLPYLKEADLSYILGVFDITQPDTYASVRQYFNHRIDEFDGLLVKAVQEGLSPVTINQFIFKRIPGLEQLDFNTHIFRELLDAVVEDPSLLGLVRNYFSSRSDELEQCIKSIPPLEPSYRYNSRENDIKEDIHKQIKSYFFATLSSLDTIISEDNAPKLCAYLNLTGFDPNTNLKVQSSGSYKSTTLLESACKRLSVNCVKALLEQGATVSEDLIDHIGLDVKPVSPMVFFKPVSPMVFFELKNVEEDKRKKRQLNAENKITIETLLRTHAPKSEVCPDEELNLDDGTKLGTGGSY
jgi:hypothetical protein